jgi:hypothetical protein
MPTWLSHFMAGAPLCGTSSLHGYLQTGQGIDMSRIKEPDARPARAVLIRQTDDLARHTAPDSVPPREASQELRPRQERTEPLIGT